MTKAIATGELPVDHVKAMNMVLKFAEDENERRLSETDGRKGWSYYVPVQQYVAYLNETNQGFFDGFKAYASHAEKVSKTGSTFNYKIGAAKAVIRAMLKRVSIDAATEVEIRHALDDVKLVKVAPNLIEVNEDKFLSEKDLAQFLDQCPDMSIKLMALFMSRTGVRISELLNIRMEDVKLGKRSNCSVRIHGKGRKERTVSLDCRTLNLIRDHFNGRTWLFEHNGKQYSRIACSQRIKTIGQIIFGATYSITAHTFRHTWATLQYEITNDIVGISRALGHSSLAITEAMYIHHNMDQEAAIFRTAGDDELLAKLEAGLVGRGA